MTNTCPTNSDIGYSIYMKNTKASLNDLEVVIG